MSTTVKKGWLHDNNGEKFAPKTLTSQVQTSDGVLIEDRINSLLKDKVDKGSGLAYLDSNNETIPDVNIVGGADIDVTAEVGQTIIVKEVDENGKPTKWESADYPLTVNEIIPQTTFNATFDNYLECYTYHGLSMDNCVMDKTKYVIWFDGVKYVRTGQRATLGGQSGSYVGNGMLATGVNTGEPFCLITADGTVGISFFGMDGNEHEVSVSVIRLDDSYTPKAALPYYIDVTMNVNDGGEIVNIAGNREIADINSEYVKGRNLVVKINVGTFIVVYSLSHIASVNGYPGFAFTGVSIGTYGQTLQISLETDGTTAYRLYFD